MDKLQGSGKSKRDGWRTELPSAGLGGEVVNKMKDEKLKDVAWQGKCSGTVYVFHIKTLPFATQLIVQVFLTLCVLFSYIAGSEQEGHFSLINEACSMSVRCNL